MIGRVSQFWRRLTEAKEMGWPLQELSLEKGPIYAIGDLHGCPDLLKGIEALIQEDARSQNGRPTLVLLGDIIDRGPDSAGLLDHLQRPLPWADRLCIQGNHEAMMLDFLDDPHKNSNWINFGGFETLRSYGLALDISELKNLSKKRIQQKITAYIPDDHIRYIKNLPFGFVTSRQDETWILAHAGFNPHQEMLNQPKVDLIWAPNFEDYRKFSDKRLIFGHFIQQEVNLDQNWIGIDTGAYKTGRLSALCLSLEKSPYLITYGPYPVSPAS